MRLQKRIGSGFTIPRGYGVACVDFVTDEAICYPIPLNWVVCFLIRAMRFLRVPPWSKHIPKAVAYWHHRHTESTSHFYKLRDGFSEQVITAVKKEVRLQLATKNRELLRAHRELEVLRQHFMASNPDPKACKALAAKLAWEVTKPPRPGGMISEQ